MNPNELQVAMGLDRALLEKAYEAAWGHPLERAFQLEVAEQLAREGAAVLRAPTGSGKTRAALLAPLAAWWIGKPLVDRVIYAVPLRSLASSLADETRKAIDRLGLALRVTLQMGGEEDDPLYERGHIIFTTIDQLLSRYLCLPYSLGARRANMCPGALLGSLIVLDEIHLYDIQRSLSTALVMLGKHLRGFARFLVMSATLSDAAVRVLSDTLGGWFRCVAADEVRRWARFSDISRRVEVADWALEPKRLLESLAEAGQPRRVIVVLNTVDRAQRLYEAVSVLPDRGAYSVKLLHSRYLAGDRKDAEVPTLRLLQKGSPPDSPPTLLIATQVIEVGLDVSCDCLHTDVAPASALIQRFGRCARWPGERGTIVVHPLGLHSEANWQFGPYRDQAPVVQHTWEYLSARRCFDMDESAATDLVEAIHAEEDHRRFASLDLGAVERQIAVALDDGELAMRRERIRDSDTLSVLVLHEIEEAPDPRRVAQWVSVPRSALYRLLARFSGSPVRTFDFDAEGPPAWPGAWKREALTVDVLRAATLLALPTSMASYSREVGLRLGEPGSATPVRVQQVLGRSRFGYQRELYLNHVNRVLRAGRELEASEYESPDDPPEKRPGMAVAFATLDQRFGKPGALAILCRLACVLHDVGKLSRAWQEWANAWERVIHTDHEAVPLAHTTFDPDRHAHLEEDFGRDHRRRPPHAVASALACAAVVEGVVMGLFPEMEELRRTNLADAVLTAIARHHAPRAREGQAFWPIIEADELVRQSLDLAEISLPGRQWIPLENISSHLPMARFETEIAVRLGVASDRGGSGAAREAMVVYWLVVRYLRIADGHSQALARVEET